MFIATIWRNAHTKIPTPLTPEDCGWIKVDDKYQFKWFDGPQLPRTVKDVVIDSEETEGKRLSTYIIRLYIILLYFCFEYIKIKFYFR